MEVIRQQFDELRAQLDELEGELAHARETNAWLRSELRTLREAKGPTAKSLLGPLVAALVVVLLAVTWWLA